MTPTPDDVLDEVLKKLLAIEDTYYNPNPMARAQRYAVLRELVLKAERAALQRNRKSFSNGPVIRLLSQNEAGKSCLLDGDP